MLPAELFSDRPIRRYLDLALGRAERIAGDGGTPIGLGEAILYRGDASRIDQFDFTKTDTLGLFGHGIYLTDNPQIAADYTLKSSEHTIVTAAAGKTPRDLIAVYLAGLIRDRFDWANLDQELSRKYQQWSRWDNATLKARQLSQKQDRLALLAKLLPKAKAIFKQQASTLRIVKNTLDEWSLVRQARSAYVSSFEVPDTYLHHVFHADWPLPDAVLQAIKRLFLDGRPDSQVFDMRDDDGKFMTFDGWVAAYKTRGIMYAWAAKDDEITDPVVKGHGANPSFDVIRNGTHFGGHWFYQNTAKFIAAMAKLGYVGMEYDGGKRLGSHVRGGGGIRHRAFVLWNAEDVNRFRVAVESIAAQDAEVEVKTANSLRASSILYQLTKLEP